MARLQIPPLEASDGTLAIVYRVASHVYGEWKVTWPQDYNAPELQPGREQGYVSRLPGGEPPPFGRRFVRQDVSIDAINGESNVERTLDEAADSLSGEVVVEREIGPEGLGNLKLGVDFKKGDLVPVAIATKVLELPVTRATYRDEAGQLTEPTIGVGYSLLVDRSGLASHNEESERRIAADLRDLAPRLKAVETTARKNTEQVDVAKKTAADAKTVAQTANSAATQAQTSADGKSTVFYGATTPAKAKAGDTWFKDVAGGTVVMQYVNGKWVEKVNAKAINDELAANKSALEDNDAALTELNDVTLPALDKRLEDNERAVGPELTAKLGTLKEELEALDTVVAQEAAAKLATLETKLADADKALKEDLQGELAALDEALSGDLTSKLAGLKGELEALDTEVAREAAANLATLETKLANANKALKEGLQGELAALDEALSGNLTSSLAGLKEELKALDADVAREAASKLATLETKLANADKALKQALQGEIAALDEALSGELATSLTSLKDELEAADAAAAAAVSTTLVQLENRLKAADKALKTDLVAQLGELEADLAALDTAVGKNLTAKLAALRTELQQADATVRTTLRGELSTLKTQLQNADTALKTDLVAQLNAARKALEDADKDINTDLSKRLEDARKDLKAASDTIAKDLAGVDMLVENQRPGNLFPDPFFKHSLWGSRYNAEEECLEITATGSTTGAYYFPDGYNVYSHLMTLEPGASYLLTIDARFSGNEVVEHATVYGRYCDMEGAWKTAALGRIDRTNEVNYKWGTISLVLTMPDNVSSEATLGFYISSAYDSGSVRLRNVRLHRAADNSLIIDGAVTAAKIKAGVIDADHIAAGAIVATKLAADSVVAGKIAANAVTANSIAANQVTTGKIAAGAVTANEIASETILAKNIKAGQITTAKIAADAVTANEIAANAVTANAIKAGEVTTAKLAADAVTANKVAADAILARNIKAGQITTAKIAADAVTANEIASDTILAKNIKAGQITTAKLAANAVTAKELAADAVSATKLLAEDATIDKLWANGIAAKSVVTNRILVAGNGNMLPEISSYHGSGYPNPDPYEEFGKNSGDPSMWLKGRTNAYIRQPINIVAGQKYRLRYQAKASVNGTSHYLFIRQGNPDGPTNPSETIRTKVDGSSSESTYLVTNGKVGTGWATFDLTFEPSTTEVAYIYIYANHTNGTENPNYQWFKDVRLEKMTGATLIEDGAITTGKIAADAVTANAIKAGEVTTAKLAADAVTANKVAADAILAKNIKAGQITTAKIAANAVTANEIAADQILAKHVKAGQITTAKLAAGAVTANEIASDTILAKNIKSGQITTEKIAANAVTANAIKAGEVTAGKIAANAVTANKIAADQILAKHVKAGQITTAKIAANAITANEIAADQVLAKHVKADQILAKHVKSGEIKAEHLLAEDATIDKLWANGIAAKSITASRLTVSPGNMFPDPDFQDPSWGVTPTGGIDRISNGISLTADGTQNGVYLQPEGKANASMQHIPGVNYLLTANLRFGGNANITRFSVYARMVRDTGVTGASKVGEFVRFPTDGQDHASYRYMDNSTVLDFSPIKMAPGGYFTLGFYVESSMESGNVEIRNVRLTPMSGTTLIEDGAITTGKVAANAITANEINTDAVTAKQIKAGEITGTHISAGKITSRELATDSVTAKQIKAGEITSSHISSSKISSDKITVANGFIKNAMIGNGEVNNAKIANLDASKITAGTINAARIGAKTITGSHLAVDTIEANQIKANVFTQVANSVLPLIPGTVNPTWTDGLKYVARSGTKDAQLPAGIPGYYRHPGGSIAAGAAVTVTNTYNNVVSIDPNLEYEASWWVRSSAGSARHIYVTLEDQNGNTDIIQKVEGVDEDGNELSQYTWGSPIRVIITPAGTTWTKYKTLFTFKEGTKSVRVNNVYFNNAGNSNAAYLYIAGLEISPNIIPQREIDERQDRNMYDLEQKLEALRTGIDAQSGWTARKLNELSEPQSGSFYPGAKTKDAKIISSTSSKITCHGSWTGYITMLWKSGLDLSSRYVEVTGADRVFSVPSYNGGMLVNWHRRPGKAYASDLARGSIESVAGAWTTVVTKTISSNDWTLNATIGWDAATYDIKYGVRVVVNGSEVTRVGPRDKLGPLTPLGDGYRTQRISASSSGINQTQTIQVQVYTNTGLKPRRMVRKVMGTLDWIDPNG